MSVLEQRIRRLEIWAWGEGEAPERLPKLKEPGDDEDDLVKAILHAVLDCPHVVDGDEIRLRRWEANEGNATSQLNDRIVAAIRKRGEA